MHPLTVAPRLPRCHPPSRDLAGSQARRDPRRHGRLRAGEGESFHAGEEGRGRGRRGGVLGGGDATRLRTKGLGAVVWYMPSLDCGGRRAFLDLSRKGGVPSVARISAVEMRGSEEWRASCPDAAEPWRSRPGGDAWVGRVAAWMHSAAAWVHRDAAWMHSAAAWMHGDAAWMHSAAAWMHGEAAWMHSAAAWMHRDAAWMHSAAAWMHRVAAWIHRDAAWMHRRRLLQLRPDAPHSLTLAQRRRHRRRLPALRRHPLQQHLLG